MSESKDVQKVEMSPAWKMKDPLDPTKDIVVIWDNINSKYVLVHAKPEPAKQPEPEKPEPEKPKPRELKNNVWYWYHLEKPGSDGVKDWMAYISRDGRAWSLDKKGVITKEQFLKGEGAHWGYKYTVGEEVVQAQSPGPVPQKPEDIKSGKYYWIEQAEPNTDGRTRILVYCKGAVIIHLGTGKETTKEDFLAGKGRTHPYKVTGELVEYPPPPGEGEKKESFIPKNPEDLKEGHHYWWRQKDLGAKYWLYLAWVSGDKVYFINSTSATRTKTAFLSDFDVGPEVPPLKR